MKLQDALDAFLLQLDADGRSPHTRRQYERHVRLFATWLHGVGAGDDVTAIDHQTVARFFAAPTAQRRADGGIRKATSANALRTSLRCFFAYCRDAAWVAENPSRLLRRAICAAPPPRGVGEAEAAKILTMLATDDRPEARRDRALVTLMLGAGLRVGSAVALDAGDVDLVRGEVRIRKAKGGREERLPLSRAVRDVLAPLLAAIGAGPLFRGRDGARVSVRHIQRRLAHFGTAAGAGHVTPHQLRHAFAQRLYRRTGDVLLVQRALTHRSVTSTMVYARCDDQSLRTAIDA